MLPSALVQDVWERFLFQIGNNKEIDDSWGKKQGLCDMMQFSDDF